jgi:sRNA-binding regulator protein Hfq
MDNASKLLELARQKFGELTEVDEKLFRAVANGEVADYSSNNEEENDPAGADKWGEERVIKADRIAWLCTDRGAKEKVSHKGIRVIGARIEGRPDLEDVKIPFSLVFLKCTFHSGIFLLDAIIHSLNLTGTHSGAINANGLITEGSVFLRDGFKLEGELNLIGANISGALDCDNGRFINQGGMAINGSAIQVGLSVFLSDDFKAKGEVSLIGAKINGQLSCVSGQFIHSGGMAINGDAMQVGADVFLHKGFKAEGEVRLRGAKISGQLACDDGQFINSGGMAINGDAIQVEADVFLREGFKTEGEVNLHGAKISGQLNCSDGQFINSGGKAINGDAIVVGADVFLRGGFKAEGEVCLLRAKISGHLNCADGQFVNSGEIGQNFRATQLHRRTIHKFGGEGN